MPLLVWALSCGSLDGWQSGNSKSHPRGGWCCHKDWVLLLVLGSDTYSVFWETPVYAIGLDFLDIKGSCLQRPSLALGSGPHWKLNSRISCWSTKESQKTNTVVICCLPLCIAPLLVALSNPWVCWQSLSVGHVSMRPRFTTGGVINLAFSLTVWKWL